MQKQKKKWLKPMLTILVRDSGKSAILSVCKSNAFEGGSGPSHGNTQCYPFISGYCLAFCEEWGTS